MSVGQGGRALWAAWWTGSGVGVGLAVGVGFAVGRGVGRGVGTSGGTVADGVETGVTGAAVGPPATIGPSVAGAEGCGSTDSLGAALAGGSVVGDGLEVALDGVAEGPLGAEVGWLTDGVPEARATSAGGRVGATTPAVNATVARMRFRTPMATTSRAR